jgi:hypothetical protein
MQKNPTKPEILFLRNIGDWHYRRCGKRLTNKKKIQILEGYITGMKNRKVLNGINRQRVLRVAEEMLYQLRNPE